MFTSPEYANEADGGFMFDLMDTKDRAIIQVFGLGHVGQELCNYIESRGVVGVEFLAEAERQYSNPTPVSASNLALVVAVEQGSGIQAIEESELNIYLVDEEDLPGLQADIERYADKSCLNYLVVLNHRLMAETGSEKTRRLIKQMDLFLPLPFSPYHENEVPHLTNQNESAYWFVRGICELITVPGLICIDFADVRTVTSQSGKAMSIHSGWFSGDKRVEHAVDHVIKLYDGQFVILRRICVNLLFKISDLSGGYSLSDLEYVSDKIGKLGNDDSTVFVGSTIQKDTINSMSISAIFSGY
jgi:hypothetical protein